MPSLAEVTAQRNLQNRVSEAARRDLQRFWMRLDLTDLVAVREALNEFLPVLVDRYGAASAELAAQWAESLLGAAVLANPVVDVAPAVSWSLTSAFQGNPTQSLSTLGIVVDRLVKQHGRDTIADSSARAGVRWARVPSGAETCAFCLILASRGDAYHSAESAGEGRKFHGDCDCVATPIRDERDLPKGYDPEALSRMYADARDKADSGSINKIAAAMRETHGIH